MNTLNKKIFNKVLMSLFTLFVLSNCAFAINLEYKNSLSKVELSRISDDSYNINLYTSKKYTDPVKIIKKNDLNYYILLPETKNSSGIISSAYSDIRSVSTDSYPYAGQDVNNGYTKINITTTKPINFNVNVKNSASNSVSYAAKAAKLTQAPIPAENQEAQKKNSENLQQTKKNLDSSKTTNAVKSDKQEKPVKKEIAANQKQPVNKTKAQTTDTKPQLKQQAKQQAKAEEKSIVKQEKAKEVKPVLEKAILNNDKITEQQNIEQQKAQEPKIEPEEEKIQVSEDTINDFEAVLKTENQEEDTSFEEKPQENGFEKFILAAKSKLRAVVNKLNNISDMMNVSLAYLILMILSGIFIFFAVLFLLTRKQKPTAKIKNRIDLLDKKVPIRNQSNSDNNGKYFILDKNVKQVVFSDPASSAIKRNYELSSYDPELKNYERLKAAKFSKDRQDSEYDIIQKILREDSLIDISAGEYDVIDSSKVSGQPQRQQEILTKQREKEQLEKEKEIAETKQTEIVTSPIVKEEMKIGLPDEPTVLSKVEIAPEKGFMCVSYNDNISLVGYIFDDVFALYNFKCSKLENYDIRYRLSDKDEYGVNFIVKVDKAKVLVRVAKNSMKLQVVL